MNYKYPIVILLLYLLLAGCSRTSNDLKIAERMMETNPDSALLILKRMKPDQYKTEPNRALYGLLLFQGLEIKDKPFPPDSIVDYSIKFYSRKKENNLLAKCYFYKGHKYKHDQQYDVAASCYIKSLDCLQSHEDLYLSGKNFADMGDICSMQMDYQGSLIKYKLAVNCFHRAGKIVDESYVILSIGRIFSNKKDFKTSQKYLHKAVGSSKDSFLQGSAYQEIGITYYRNNQYDSAQYYLRKSLKYPFKSTNYAIRCFSLADLLFDINQNDSAYHYAKIALNHPGNFFLKRDCYRILTNVEYTRNNIKQVGIYMAQYQNYADSIRTIQSQTKSTVLENLHLKTLEANSANRNTMLIFSILLIICVLSVIVVYLLYKRNTFKKLQLEIIKEQLSSKQQFVSQNLFKKLEENRILQTDARRNALADERLRLDIELYEKTLHLNDWEVFSCEINHAFNQIVETLESRYPTITRKEITWCCLHLLNIPNSERILLLDATADSLYKLKQRLAQKMNLKSTKEIHSFLKELTVIKD